MAWTNHEEHSKQDQKWSLTKDWDRNIQDPGRLWEADQESIGSPVEEADLAKERRVRA